MPVQDEGYFSRLKHCLEVHLVTDAVTRYNHATFLLLNGSALLLLLLGTKVNSFVHTHLLERTIDLVRNVTDGHAANVGSLTDVTTQVSAGRATLGTQVFQGLLGDVHLALEVKHLPLGCNHPVAEQTNLASGLVSSRVQRVQSTDDKL